MAVTESFLVNTDSFNPIIEALMERDEAPDEVTDELFASMGFDSPSELLVIHMLKELNMLTVEGEPTDLFYDLINPDTTDEAVATGILHAYTDLFKGNREFYKLPKEEIRIELENHFEGRKTDLILKYMTNTFHTLVNYAGFKNMQKAVADYFEEHGDEMEKDLEETPAASSEVAETGDMEQETTAEASDSEENEEQELEETVKSEEIEEEDQDSESDPDIVEAGSGEESDDEFDDIFFSEEEETSEPLASEEDKPGSGINFDELPQVQREEKGSESIEEFLGEGPSEQEETEADEQSAVTSAEEEQESEEEETEDFSSTSTSTANNEGQADVTEEETSDNLSEEQKESLEKELMEIDMESTNGLHTNGAENTEKTMKNLSNLPTKEKVEKALIKKAELLYKLEKFEDVLPAYKDVISYFDNSDKEHHREAVANAVINQVSVLKKLGREEDLLPALEEVIDRFRESSTNEYYEEASLAMLEKAQLLEDASGDELLPLFEDIIDRLRNATASKIRTQVDEIFVKRVDLLSDTDSEERLLDAVDDLIDRFEGSQTHTGQLEEAMYKKAEILENLGRDEEALEAYSEFLEMFGKTKEEMV